MATKRLWNERGESVEVPESWPEFPEYRKRFPLDEKPKAPAPKEKPGNESAAKAPAK